MQLFFQYIVAIFFISTSTLSHLHPLQNENCESNSRLVVDEDDNGKFRLKMMKAALGQPLVFTPWSHTRQITCLLVQTRSMTTNGYRDGK